MECTYEDTADGIRIIRLSGRMDIEGNDEIALRFTALATTAKKAIVVDLSGLEFLSSLGMSTLVMAAKALSARKGLLVMCGAEGTVQKALDRTKLPIPLLSGLEEARARVLPVASE